MIRKNYLCYSSCIITGNNEKYKRLTIFHLVLFFFFFSLKTWLTLILSLSIRKLFLMSTNIIENWEEKWDSVHLFSFYEIKYSLVLFRGWHYVWDSIRRKWRICIHVKVRNILKEDIQKSINDIYLLSLQNVGNHSSPWIPFLYYVWIAMASWER